MNEYYADRFMERLSLAKKMQPFLDPLGQTEKKNLKVYLLDERFIVVEIDWTMKSI